jgi:excisionase family DNA binding protein
MSGSFRLGQYARIRQFLSRSCETDIRRGTVARVDPDAAAAAGSDYPPVLTAAMAAELLQVNVEYLRRMVREGRIPCHRFPGGREMRFLRDEVLGWLAALPGDDQSTSPSRTHQIEAAGT